MWSGRSHRAKRDHSDPVPGGVGGMAVSQEGFHDSRRVISIAAPEPHERRPQDGRIGRRPIQLGRPDLDFTHDHVDPVVRDTKGLVRRNERDVIIARGDLVSARADRLQET